MKIRPGTPYVSGSQDALGIVMPGLNKYEYNGDYWPESIESNLDSDILEWLEKYIWLVPLYPRGQSYNGSCRYAYRCGFGKSVE